MTGIEMIAKERQEQIEKHGRTIKKDVKLNTARQLSSAAKRLLQIYPDPLDAPYNWDFEIWENMCVKTYAQRLVIAGALIAAELDRLKHSRK